jgi:hypothetical protein
MEDRTVNIKPIETFYKGYRFRSRLEARWAVFFDAVGIRWEYEKEGYNFFGACYLPDFWLPDLSLWAEVKPEPFSPKEVDKARWLLWTTRRDVIMLVGAPETRIYEAISGDGYALFPYKDFIFDAGLVQLDYADRPYVEFPDSYKAQLKNFVAGMTEFQKAVIAARSARFEHGEKPHVR